MNNESIGARISEIAETIAGKRFFEFVHSEIVGGRGNLTVRIFIDKTGGVSLDDCSNFSREIEAVLDVEDFIPSAYVLEVSSPGLERGLYSLKDFEKFAGQNAKVKLGAAINGQRNFSGKIAAVEGIEIVFEDKTTGTVRFPHQDVVKANLQIDLEKEFERK